MADNFTILIVEDNELNMKLVRTLLKPEGHHVIDTRQFIDTIRQELATIRETR